MKYIVYKTTNLINNKYYIGVHKLGSRSRYYLGSGIHIRKAIKKYGRKSFVRETLFEFETKEEAYKKESELVTKESILHPLSYNACPGGLGSSYAYCDKSYTKTDKFRTKMKLVTSGKNNGMYGKRQSELCKTINSLKAKKSIGCKSTRFKGWWVCGEYGRFGSQREAEEVIGSSCVYFRCIQSKSDRWKNWYFEKIGDIK